MKLSLMWQWRADRNVSNLCVLSTENRRVNSQSPAVLDADFVPVQWVVAMKSVACAVDNLRMETAAVVDFDRSIVGSATVVDRDALVAFAALVAVVSHALVVSVLVLLVAFVALFLAVAVGNVVAFVVRRVVAVVESNVAVNRALAVVTVVETLVLASGMEESVPVRDDRLADPAVRSAATVVFSLVLVAAAQYKN